MVPSRALTVVVGLTLAAGRALAHTGHETHAESGGTDPAVPIALVGAGVLVLGTSVYLDRAGELGGRWADLGVLLGVVGLLAGVVLALV